MPFLGLGLADNVPDANMIWTFGEALTPGIAVLKGLPSDALEDSASLILTAANRGTQSLITWMALMTCFFIALGEARATNYSSAAKAGSILELGSGKISGEYPAIDRGPQSATVEARTNCLIASMPGASFRELLDSEPGVAQALPPELVKSIRSVTTRVYEPALSNNRIHADLLRLAGLFLVTRKPLKTWIPPSCENSYPHGISDMTIRQTDQRHKILHLLGSRPPSGSTRSLGNS